MLYEVITKGYHICSILHANMTYKSDKMFWLKLLDKLYQQGGFNELSN